MKTVYLVRHSIHKKYFDGELNINDGESNDLKFFSLDNLPELESRAKVIIDKIKEGHIKL